jgi:hypothetical protein
MSDSEARSCSRSPANVDLFPSGAAQRSLPFALRPVGMHGKMLRQGCQLEARRWYCWNEKTGETRYGAHSKFSCVVDFPRTLEMHTRSCTRQPVRLPLNNGHGHGSLSWPCVKPMGTQFATINQKELSDTQKGSFTRTAYQVPAHGEQRD